MTDRAAAVAALRRARPRSRVLRLTAVAAAALLALAWGSGQIAARDLVTERRAENLERFLTEEALPEPMREGEGLGATLAWAREILAERGLEALAATLWLAVAAGVLAAVVGLVVAPFAARNLAARHPFADPESVGGIDAQRGRWRYVNGVARGGCVAARALPEYILAFVLGAILPSAAWAAVLALAIHNGGILGRLFAETLENLPRGPLAALRVGGAGRGQLAVLVALPLALPRLLLYSFYRFETCVREATVLGMLGFVSLGYWIQEARARFHYDEMLLLVGLGVGIVLAGDLASYACRALVRRAA